MRKIRKKQLLFLFIACMIGLFGCSRTRVIDNISIVHVFGMDLTENGDILGTVLIPDYSLNPDVDQIQSLEEQVPNGSLFLPKLSTHTSTPVELAKIRVIVFGKDFAESGIEDMVERFIFTPELGTNLQIAISTHSAKETLNTFMQENSLTLIDRIEHNMVEQFLPKMNLHLFLNHFFGEGMDAYVPILTIDKQNRIKIDGIAIFNGDKFQLHVKPEEASLFSYIKDKRSQATYRIDLDGEERQENITIQGFRSSSVWDWNKENEEVTLHLELKMTLNQYPNRFNLNKTEDLNKIKSIVAKKLEEDINKLITTFKENEVDPLGIGNIVRSQDKNWEEKEFYSKYPELSIHAKVNVQIIHSGLEG